MKLGAPNIVFAPRDKNVHDVADRKNISFVHSQNLGSPSAEFSPSSIHTPRLPLTCILGRNEVDIPCSKTTRPLPVNFDDASRFNGGPVGRQIYRYVLKFVFFRAGRESFSICVCVPAANPNIGQYMGNGYQQTGCRYPPSGISFRRIKCPGGDIKQTILPRTVNKTTLLS